MPSKQKEKERESWRWWKLEKGKRYDKWQWLFIIIRNVNKPARHPFTVSIHCLILSFCFFFLHFVSHCKCALPHRCVCIWMYNCLCMRACERKWRMWQTMDLCERVKLIDVKCIGTFFSVSFSLLFHSVFRSILFPFSFLFIAFCRLHFVTQ